MAFLNMLSLIRVDIVKLLLQIYQKTLKDMQQSFQYTED